jgi:ascorbate PTS system EIIA or EIIAB component
MKEVVTAARHHVRAEDWRAAVRAASQLLVDAGAAEPRYVDRCIATVEELGPYMVVAPGVALAHARPEDGAVALGLSAVTLREPVEFGHAENDPVDVVFAFGSPDRDQHVGLLGALARRLTEGLADDLRKAGDESEVTRLMEEVASAVE